MHSLLESSSTYIEHFKYAVIVLLISWYVHFIVNKHQPLVVFPRNLIDLILLLYIPLYFLRAKDPHINIFNVSLGKIYPGVQVTKLDCFGFFFYMRNYFIKKKAFAPKYHRMV